MTYRVLTNHFPVLPACVSVKTSLVCSQPEGQAEEAFERNGMRAVNVSGDVFPSNGKIGHTVSGYVTVDVQSGISRNILRDGPQQTFVSKS